MNQGSDQQGTHALIAHPSADGTIAPQGLEEHLKGVAARARSFAEAFDAGPVAELAGRWHDIGKASADWQEYIRSVTSGDSGADVHRRSGPSHSPLGAIAVARMDPRSLLLGLVSMVIGGHHGGLPNKVNWREMLRNPEHLDRLAKLALFEATGQVEPPPGFESRSPTGIELFTRMLFSTLVDADFLDTEDYLARSGNEEALERSEARRVPWPTLEAYRERLEAFLAKKQTEAPDTPVNRLRRRVLEACLAASPASPGAFTLTVPTGGGKTLSSLAFALAHALRSAQRRVIIALPFTSIIDQTADVLRAVFAPLGENVVLEHHSAVEPRSERAAFRAAAENWDAPLVVTTQVQLLESLFANRSARCRKLHRIAGSVLILDEVQSLPHGVLHPILDVLDDLVKHYRVTLVLTTATQPSLQHRPLPGGETFPGLDPAPREIIPVDLRDELWAGLRRVRVTWPVAATSTVGPEEYWAALAEELSTHRQVLAIVHLKRDAQTLLRSLACIDPRALHLSAAMCPVHRRQVLERVRRRLKDGKPCRLVSTQVIEAGVDIDFPVVYRAMAGLESLAQSAGRCNREGRLPGPGDFRVFVPPTRPPQSLRTPRDTAVEMLSGDPDLDLLVPETFTRYFERLHSRRDLDQRQVQELRRRLQFLDTAQAFRMIDGLTDAVIVPFDDRARKLTRRLLERGPSRQLLRKLQPYSVSVYQHQRQALERQGALVETAGILTLGDFTPNPFYNDTLGLVTEADASRELIA